MASNSNFIALAGNPNSGKTTAFNWYTGTRQHVGNYPGITVEKKEGRTTIDGEQITLVDLPGTYSLTAYSMEEVVSRRVITEDKPGAVLDIINASVFERNLYLAVQIREMGIPTVIALNMMDEAKAQGIHINIEKFEQLTKIKAIPTVAKSGEGLAQALGEAVKLAKQEENKARIPLVISYGPDIDEALSKMIPLVESVSLLEDKYPSRWTALKFLENDEEIMKLATLANSDISTKLKDIAKQTASHIKTTTGSYPEAIIADYRYGYISSILRQGVLTESKEIHDRIAYSDKMDRVLTHKFIGPAILVGFLYLIYYVTFELGAYPQGWVEDGFGWLSGVVKTFVPDGLLQSMLTAGVIDGAGGVLSFVPLILIMFVFIAIMEDSGYMARVAYMFDRIFRFFGLHGASVMPFIVSGGIAGGCAIPGVMATRTLRSPKERLATMLTCPFMTCGAKIPVFLLFVGIFFKEHQAAVMFSITVAAWVAALLVSRLLRSTIIKGESTPFVMELPPYRIPTLKGVLIHTWERAWHYIKKAGTIILAISIILWAAMTFPSLSEHQVMEYNAQRAPLEEKLDTYEFKALSDQIAELTAQIEEMGAGEELDQAEVKLENLNNLFEMIPAGKLTLQLGELEDQLAVLEEGSEEAEKMQAQIDELQGELDQLPEIQLIAKITELTNDESRDALRSSLAGRVGIALETVSAPAGFDWRTNIALVGGIAAKEVVVSTLGTAYALGEIDEDNDANLAARIQQDDHWTRANALALIVFTLLYSPCFVTLAVIKNETGKWRWLFFSFTFNLVFAYAAAVATNQVVSRFFL